MKPRCAVACLLLLPATAQSRREDGMGGWPPCPGQPGVHNRRPHRLCRLAQITCWSASGEARDVTVPLSYSVADLSGELHRLGLTATLEARLIDPERPLSVLPSCKSLAEAGVADGGVVVALVDTPCVVQDPPPPRKVGQSRPLAGSAAGLGVCLSVRRPR